MWSAFPEHHLPSRAGTVVGWLLLALAGGCFILAFEVLDSAPVGQTPFITSAAAGWMFGWLGFCSLFLGVVPAALFARDPRLVGGPVGQSLRRAAHLDPQRWRLAPLSYAWWGAGAAVY